MATKPQAPPSKPRHLLTVAGQKDLESSLIPTFFVEGRLVPNHIHSRRFTSAGAPGRGKPRRFASLRPSTSHAEVSDHAYVGRFKKPERWMWSGENSGRKVDERNPWHATNKPPTSINPHSLAATSSSWGSSAAAASLDAATYTSHGVSLSPDCQAGGPAK